MISKIVPRSVALLHSLSPNLNLCRHICGELSRGASLLYWLISSYLVDRILEYKFQIDQHQAYLIHSRTQKGNSYMHDRKQSIAITKLSSFKQKLITGQNSNNSNNSNNNNNVQNALTGDKESVTYLESSRKINLTRSKSVSLRSMTVRIRQNLQG